MKTTLFLSVSLDGLIADRDGIPRFPDSAWEDWCSLVNDADNVIAGRRSYEQLQQDGLSSMLHPTHKIVLSSGHIERHEPSWQQAKSPTEALEKLEQQGIQEAIIGGGRSVACTFMRARLIDFLVLDLQPVVFGVGTAMFGEDLEMPRLKLVHVNPLQGDARRLRYQVLS